MKTLRDVDVRGKKVLVRVDFNVPLENGRVVNDFRIRAVLPTIEYLREQKAKVILLTHLGRPNGKIVEELKVDPIAEKLSEFFPVEKLDDCVNVEIKENDSVVLLENVQFYAGEKEKSPEFIKALVSLADVFVLEAFGQAHRDYASISGLPFCAGLLMEKEIKNLSEVLNNPKHPLVVVVGGKKISTKIKMIKSFLEKADDLILGGVLANTVIAAKGLSIGKSVSEKSMEEEVKKLKLTNTKLHIPFDVIVSTDISGQAPVRIAPVGRTEKDEMILDIGPDTISLYKDVIKSASMIIWNGPMGVIESEKFVKGSEQIALAIAESEGFSVVGGGESIILLNKLGIKDKINHISTGGGAMLNFLAGEKLPGVEALK
jgi:phosphoglycerate kinase